MMDHLHVLAIMDTVVTERAVLTLMNVRRTMEDVTLMLTVPTLMAHLHAAVTMNILEMELTAST